jgi:pimeloyl-ACP methyl ester carboxylesterase
MTLKIKNETFNGTFPFSPHYLTINGFQMHYVDEGQGEPIVCVHGEPTWGYLYRKFISELRGSNRMVVPDHMGFGKSEIPLDKEYRLSQHVDNIAQLLLKLDLHDISLVVQDWGGPIGFGFAVRYPERVKRIIIMNTSVGIAKEGQKLWYETLIERGLYDQLLGDMDTFVPSYMLNVMKRKFTREEKKQLIKAYTAPFPDAESHIGVKAFPLDIPKGNSHPSSAIMQEIRKKLPLLQDKQKTLIWGMQDTIFPPKVIEFWKRIYPDIEVHPLDNAGHFLQEDAPEEIIQIIKNFVQMK